MNTRHDTQIDALLRDGFAPETSARVNPNASDALTRTPVAPDDSHLDVDELSALTATTLPEATRAAYIKHLTACDACRRQAAMLALTASSETATAHQSDDTEIQVAPDITNNIDAPPDFWKSFTPPFNLASVSGATYTFAALAALVVLALSVGLFVRLNNQNSSGEIAMHTDSPREAVTQNDESAMKNQASDELASAMNANTANSNAMTMNGNMAQGASELYAANSNINAINNFVPNASPNLNAANQTTKNQIAELPINGRNANSLLMLAPSSTPAPASPQAGSSSNESVTVTADAPAPPPPPSPAARLEPRDSRITESNNAIARESRRDMARQSDEDALSIARPQKNEEQGLLRRTKPDADASSDITGERKKTSPSSAAAPRARAVTSNDTARIIGNRRFTRQSETWIDSSYRTPMRVTNVKRGSEGFRTLITRDASVRLIVEQLAGSVIVVVNNQAYRVQ